MSDTTIVTFSELVAVIKAQRGLILPLSTYGHNYHVAVIPPAPDHPTVGVIVRDSEGYTATTSHDVGAPAEPGAMLGHLLRCVLCEATQRQRKVG
jgi:hypothetical protein